MFLSAKVLHDLTHAGELFLQNYLEVLCFLFCVDLLSGRCFALHLSLASTCGVHFIVYNTWLQVNTSGHSMQNDQSIYAFVDSHHCLQWHGAGPHPQRLSGTEDWCMYFKLQVPMKVLIVFKFSSQVSATKEL